MSALISIIVIFFIFPPVWADWKIDFSRRNGELRKQELKQPQKASEKFGFVDLVLGASESAREIVILNTENGFIPSAIHLKKMSSYKVHIVNVNSKTKNVSFVLDAFSEHHATYFGKIKTFHIRPKEEGIFSYQCPETSYQGKIVVFQENHKGPGRRPAAIK